MIWKCFEPLSWPAPVRLLAEFAIFILPQTFYFLFPRFDLLLLAVLAVALTLGMVIAWKSRVTEETEDLMAGDVPRIDKRPIYITYYRSCIMIMTVICILAVDFAPFPRRYWKTGANGTGLMDLGVGTIIFAAGTVASFSTPNMLNAFKTNLPLLLIGISRVVIMKTTGYLNGSSDTMGMHWNFFLTLGLIPFLTPGIRLWIPGKVIAIVGLFLSIGYEVILKLTGLESYINGGGSSGFIGQNKEGLFGILGFISLYMISCGISELMKQNQSDLKLMFRKLFALSMFAWATYWCLKAFGFLASRRLVNLQFNIWITALSTLHLALFVLSEVVTPKPAGHAYLLEAINQNQLLVFLLANVMTGAVNFAIKTRSYGELSAFGIVSGYALILSLLAFVLKRYDITVRFR